MKYLSIVFMLVSLLAAVPLHAEEMTFKPAYETPLKGPAAAAGAIIWSHGANSYYGVGDVTASAPATFVRSLRDAGWDIYRLNRPTITEELKRSSGTLRERAEELKRQGYRKVVLAGQSAGGWISIIVAGQTDVIHAVIADAPAYRGVNWGQKERNASELYDNLETVKRGRIMVSFFANDPYDPGGRGPKATEILQKSGVPHLVVDNPPGFSGHGAANGSAFARRFGACVLAMIGDGPVPTQRSCEAASKESGPSEAFKPPADLRIAEAQGAPVDPFLGKWFGVYPNGREFMLVIEKITGERIDAAYIAGPFGKTETATTRRQGHLAPNALMFDEPGKSKLVYSLRDDDDLDARWEASDGKSTLTAVMRRLP